LIHIITLKPITVDNFEDCLGLAVAEQQRAFIASNAYSLSEAYALTNHELYVPMPYGVYHNDTIVGFCLVVYQPIDEKDPDDDENVYYLSRIMIDKRYQGRGYGKAALQKVVEVIKTFPHGPATAIVLASNPNNQPASLFQAFGFKEMGITNSEGDNYLRLDL